MKIRSNYVSNSSSSSFIIHNWFDIPEDKRYYIECYDEGAFEIWHKKKLKYEKFKDDFVYCIEYPFYGEEYQLLEPNKKYNFGTLNNICRWRFEEDKETNTCKVSCSMDNFNMETWLKYNKVDFEEEK